MNEPNSGLLAQGLRFAIAGGTVAIVYIGTTTLLAGVVGLHFQLALAIGFCLALIVHFSLQRMFVWARHEEFALPLRHQAGRYLVAALAQYGITVASTSWLPTLLGAPTEVVYLATVAIVLSANFLVFRYGIFHAKPANEDQVTVPSEHVG
jgi:putative flippase GtrA